MVCKNDVIKMTAIMKGLESFQQLAIFPFILKTFLLTFIFNLSSFYRHLIERELSSDTSIFIGSGDMQENITVLCQLTHV